MSDLAMRLTARPLYLQVRDALVARVTAGEWKPGGALPNEIHLAREMQISIGTVRKALDIMVGERIVTRHQGRGTFVNDFAASDAPSLFSTIFNSAEQPFSGEKRVKSMVRVPAGDEHASRLGLRTDDEVIRIERLRFHEGTCFMIETCFLPAKFYNRFPDDGARSRISALAQLNGFVVGRAVEQVGIVLADEDDAKKLEIAQNTPLLRLDRRVFSNLEHILEWRVARCFLRNERYLVHFN